MILIGFASVIAIVSVLQIIRWSPGGAADILGDELLLYMLQIRKMCTRIIVLRCYVFACTHVALDASFILEAEMNDLLTDPFCFCF